MINSESLTVQEAANHLKVHPETIRVWLRDGRLQGVQPVNKRVGWRIPATEFARLLPFPCPACGTVLPIPARGTHEITCENCGQRLVTHPHEVGRWVPWNPEEQRAGKAAA
jgi:excisionase family DNA binding protein